MDAMHARIYAYNAYSVQNMGRLPTANFQPRERERDRATQPPGFNRFGLKFSPLGIAGGIWTQRGHYLKEHIAEQLEPSVNDTVSHAESQTAVKQTAVKRSLDYEMLFHFKTTKLSQIIKK